MFRFKTLSRERFKTFPGIPGSRNFLADFCNTAKITSAALLARPLSFFTNGSYRDFTFTGFLVFPVFLGLRNFLWIFTPTEKNAGVLSVFTILVLTLAIVLGTSYPANRQAGARFIWGW